MHAANEIRAFLARHFHSGHAQRFRAVTDAVIGIIRGGRASVTSIGRNMPTPIAPKHAIKRADRLLGNTKLLGELGSWYRQIARLVIAKQKRPLVLLDWTDLGHGLASLRAAVAIPGRSIPIYEEVHRKSDGDKRRVHRRFLQRLRAVTEGAELILVADAEFRTPFFGACMDVGLDFVIRLRGGGIVDFGRKRTRFRNLWRRASNQARCLGMGIPHNGARQGRLLRIVLGPRTKRRPKRTDDAYQARAVEPWLLATTLENEAAAHIVAVYEARMRIEESFRDTKSISYGWDVHGRTRHPDRARILLLLAALAYLVVVLAGIEAENRGANRRYQANTTRSRRVLSLFRLGILVLMREPSVLAPLKHLRALVDTLGVPDTPAHRRYGRSPPHALFCHDCGEHFAAYGWPPAM